MKFFNKEKAKEYIDRRIQEVKDRTDIDVATKQCIIAPLTGTWLSIESGLFEYEDHIHLNPTGNQLVAEQIWQTIRSGN